MKTTNGMLTTSLNESLASKRPKVKTSKASAKFISFGKKDSYEEESNDKRSEGLKPTRPPEGQDRV